MCSMNCFKLVPCRIILTIASRYGQHVHESSGDFQCNLDQLIDDNCLFNVSFSYNFWEIILQIFTYKYFTPAKSFNLVNFFY